MRTLKEILILVRDKHLEDIKSCKLNKLHLYGLCLLCTFLNLDGVIDITEKRIFIDHLTKSFPDKDLRGFFWKRDFDNTERLEWLNAEIEKL